MSFYLFDTAEAAREAFARRQPSPLQAEAELMFAGRATTEGVDPEAPVFNEWDIMVVTQQPRDAFIVRGGELISVHSMVPTTREEKAASGSALYKLAELTKQDRKLAIYQAIAAQIGERASVMEGRLKIDGEAVWDLSITEDRSSNYHGARQGAATGKTSVTVGDYGGKSRFPQRKDGSHNYPEIAVKLVAAHDRRAVKEKSQQRQTSNRITYVEALQKEFGYGSGWAFNATADESKPVRVERKLAFSGTPEQVRQFMAMVDKALAETK